MKEWFLAFCLAVMASPFAGKAQTLVDADVFFQGFDFADTALVRSEAFAQRLADYIYQYYSEDDVKETDYIIGLSPLFVKAKACMPVYEFVLGFMLNGFENLGLEQVTTYLLNFPSLFENEVDYEQGKRLEAIAEPFQKVKVGMKAPDFSGVTSTGVPYCLYESDAPRTVVVFWATGCEHCHAFLKRLQRKTRRCRDLEWVTMAIAENEAEWREDLERMDLPGSHFFDAQRWTGQAFADYHVTEVPMAFVLDAEKTIVCKTSDWEELKFWIKYNK